VNSFQGSLITSQRAIANSKGAVLTGRGENKCTFFPQENIEIFSANNQVN
jgi:hypothetical protein